MTDPSSPDAGALSRLLGADAPRPWWRRPGPWLLLVAVLAAAGAGWWWLGSRRQADGPSYVSTPLARGHLAITVTATGTLQPTRSVAIGSELSGTVTRVLVDVNDVVRKGQLLVELDTARLQDAVRGAEAELASAQARVLQAQATRTEAEAALARQDELARVSGGKLPSRADHDAARATAERARADLASAQAAVNQARATLSTNQTSLSKAQIRSPIDGVVLARNVEPGYAVAASLQAVTLFTLAEDLKQLRLSVNVDEADVAQVQAGQSARFTVAAQPGRQYPAQVTRVAFGSTITDNVVTYTTLLDVANQDLSLRPGMTATASIAARERRDVWLVPNSALRYSPQGAGARAGNSSGGGIVAKLLPRPPGSGGAPRSAGPAKQAGEGTIWVLREGQPAALRVRTGLSDGRQTEVSGEGLQAGLAVITDQSGGAR